MQFSARYLSVCLMILGLLASPASSAFAANAKVLSDIQLDNSRLNDEDIVCWSLEKNDPRLEAAGGRYFVLKPGTDTAKSERSKKTFLLTSSKKGKSADIQMALRGNGVPEAAKVSSDIPFTPEVLEISQSDMPVSSGVACTFVGGPRKKMRILELTGSLEDGEQGPGKIGRRFRRGDIGQIPQHKIFNPFW